MSKPACPGGQWRGSGWERLELELLLKPASPTPSIMYNFHSTYSLRHSCQLHRHCIVLLYTLVLVERQFRNVFMGNNKDFLQEEFSYHLLHYTSKAKWLCALMMYSYLHLTSPDPLSIPFFVILPHSRMCFADSEGNVFIAVDLKTCCQILDSEYRNAQKMAKGFFLI